jgi:hypothetical protein
MIKFETKIENGIILVPAELNEYLNSLSRQNSGVEITIAELNEDKAKIERGMYAGSDELPPDYFQDDGFLIDTKSFKFSREEANERR